jgi:O-antigen/teichoic acid export membrane protein
VTTLLNIAIFRIDVLLVEAKLGPADVGSYGAVVRIVELSMLPFAVVVPMALTSFRMQTTTNSLDFRARTFTLFFRVASMSAVSSMVIATIGPQLIQVLYGSQFSTGTSSAVRLLSIAVPFAVCVTLRDSYFSLIKRESLVVWGPLLGLPINVGLNLFLLPRMGITGASIASVAGYAVALLVPFALLTRNGQDLRTRNSYD